MQTVTLVGIFVASGGNLAATYVANVANQLIFTILQERCALRAKEVGGWVGGVGVGVGVGVYVGVATQERGRIKSYLNFVVMPHYCCTTADKLANCYCSFLFLRTHFC